MKVLVCGSRDWTDPKPIRLELDRLLARWSYNTLTTSASTMDEYRRRVVQSITIVHGDARGADKMAREIAAEMGFPVITVPAQWDKYGKKAGVLRNEQMLREFGPIDLVIAFHEDLSRSKGTKDMIARAVRDGIKVIIVSKPRQKGGYGASLTRTLAR